MDKADQYRVNAAECQQQADRTFRPEDKQAWLKLAESWLRMLHDFELAHTQAGARAALLSQISKH